MLIDRAMDYFPLSNGAKIVLYILQHTDVNTKIFSRTYNQIQKDLNVSQPTISKVFKTLKENETLIPAGVGKWYVPAVVGYSDTAEGPEIFVRNKL